MLQRTTTPEDRRQAPLFLTDAAQALMGEFSETGRSYLNAVAAKLGPAVMDTVTAALERLAEAAGAVTDVDGEDDGDAPRDGTAAEKPVQTGATAGRSTQRSAPAVTP